MSLFINTNRTALNISNNLNRISNKRDKASAKLSSGLRINSASDDAAGLVISEKMRAQIRGLRVAEKNVEDGMSLLKTQDGGMEEISNMIIRQRELIIQALNDTNTDDEKQLMQCELDALTAGIDSIASGTKFNNIPLLTVRASDISTTDNITPLALDYMNTMVIGEIKAVSTNDSQNTQSIINKIPWTPLVDDNGQMYSLYAVSEDGTEGSVLGFVSAESITLHDVYNGDSDWDCKTYYNKNNQPAWQQTETTSIFDLSHTLATGTIETIPLEITRTITIIDSPDGDGQLYKMEYQLYCNTEYVTYNRSEYTFDFSLDILPQLGETVFDLPGFSFDVNETGTNLNDGNSFTGSNVPDRVDIFSPDMTNINITLVLGAENTPKPDEMSATCYPYQLDNTLYAPSSKLSVSWNNIHLNRDESVTLTFYYGVTTPKNNTGTEPDDTPSTEPNDKPDDKPGTEPGTNPTDENNSANLLYIQSGANTGQAIYIKCYDCRTDSLGINNIKAKPREEAEKSLDKLDLSLSVLNSYRALNGATYNRLEHTSNSLGVFYTNLEYSDSVIADAYMAKEMMAYTKENILSQVAVTMLVQANQSPEMVLQLLK